MVKQIPIDRLRVGMYVHDINCSWLHHPFLFNHLLIKDEETLRKVQRTGTRNVYIDTARGKDVAADHPEGQAKSEAQVERELLAELNALAEEVRRRPERVSVQEEFAFARATVVEANQLISAVMHNAKLGRQIALTEVQEVVGRMAESIFRSPQAMLSLTRIRQVDHYTFEHSVSVAVLMLTFARELALPAEVVQEIGVGALLHDIGKVEIPLQILNKPDKLTEEEYAIMQGHVEHGRRLLEATPGISDIALAITAEHHERWDGHGYPRGLIGDRISRFGQMAAIVDVYDAVTADRCYHKGEEPTVVLRQLLEWSRQHFNTTLVHQFIRCVGIYPVGTLVHLNHGLLAVVIEPGRRSLLQPKVKLVYDTEEQRFVPPEEIDLAALPPGSDYRIESAAAERVWKIRGYEFMG